MVINWNDLEMSPYWFDGISLFDFWKQIYLHAGVVHLTKGKKREYLFVLLSLTNCRTHSWSIGDLTHHMNLL